MRFTFPSSISTAARRICCVAKNQHLLRHTTHRLISSQREIFFRELGYLDENGLTKFNTLHEMQVRACEVYEENRLFGTYQANKFEYMTYGKYGDHVDVCRKVLVDLGVMEHDKVAIISNNRWEWATIAAASYSLSATLVPMYEAQRENDWTYMLNDSGARIVACATKEIFGRVQKNVLPYTPSIQASICFESDEEGEDYGFTKLMAGASAERDIDKATACSLIQAPTPDDLANLIYTSGTKGQLMGVELTHANLTSNVKASRSMASNPKEFIRETDRTLAFLPWAHSYGQICELWSGISMGTGMAICRGVANLFEDLKLVKPTRLVAVPAVYKKVYEGVCNSMENANPIKRSLMRTALDLGVANAEYRNGKRGPLGPVDQIKFSLLDSIVLSKFRDRFGGNMRHGFVAGAACSPEVLRFMESLGIPIYEGYGSTEASPIISVSFPEDRSIGSVGRPIGEVKIYIVDETGHPLPPGEEGEICCVGPNVMSGYHNKPEATKEVLSVAPDSLSPMFHTGDLGRMDTDGLLRVTGRLKEHYNLDNGQYIVPTRIETPIGMSRFISQVIVCGANRPFNIALLVPEWSAIRKEFEFDDNFTEEEMSRDGRVTDLVDDELISCCANLEKSEIPQKWAFVAPFTAANNMLTPKMSIRRHKVMEAHDDVISELYAESNGGKEAKEILFPMQGISVRYLTGPFLDILRRHGVDINGKMTREIRQEIIKITLPDKCSFCDMLAQQGKVEYVSANPVAFISHAHDLQFEDLLSAVEWHFRNESDAIVWLDIFSINQHTPVAWTYEWLSTAFRSNVAKINRTVMVMAPWNNPLPYTRSWCIFEAFSTIQAGGKFEIAMAKNDEAKFLEDITEDPQGNINHMLATISSERSECYTPNDRASIFAVIRADIGFLALDSIVFERYRGWVIEVTCQALEACEDASDQLDLLLALGILYGGQGRHDEAIKYRKQAVELSMSLYGDEHPDTLVSTTNLASSLYSQGRYVEAERLLTASLDEQKAVLGDEHPSTLLSMTNLALSLDKQGRHDEAEELHTTCLQKQKVVLGDSHPDTLLSMHNLALSLAEQSRHSEAEELLQACLEEQKTVLGDDHPLALSSMNSLANLLSTQGRHSEAHGLLISCLAKQKAILGEDHPHTVASMSGLAILLQNQGRHGEAEELHRTCLQKRKAVLGDDHPNTLLTMNKLATSLLNQGQYAEAEELYKVCYEKSKAVLGDNHQDTIAIENKMKRLQRRASKS